MNPKFKFTLIHLLISVSIIVFIAIFLIKTQNEKQRIEESKLPNTILEFKK